MPKDRRALRGALGRERGQQAAPRRLLGFDFDCTLTCRHFYKVMSWGYAQGNRNAHPHCKAFLEWCAAHNVKSVMPDSIPFGDTEDTMMLAVEAFCAEAGEDAFAELFREIFLGGQDRIALVAASLQRLQAAGVEFAIITRGSSMSILRGLAATPEWLQYFSSSHIWDTSQSRHRGGGANTQKSLMLRDLSPSAARILLVDDSLAQDGVPQWVQKAAGVEVYPLPYEGPGLTEAMLTEIEAIMLG